MGNQNKSVKMTTVSSLFHLYGTYLNMLYVFLIFGRSNSYMEINHFIKTFAINSLFVTSLPLKYSCIPQIASILQEMEKALQEPPASS